MFERFTERARQVVTHAQGAAREQGAETITTGHLLVGLLREEGGLAGCILAARDITEERVLSVGEWPKGPLVTGQIPFEPKAKHALELALREALSLAHNYIGTEHVLLGLVREDDEILRSLGADGELIRNDVIRALGSGRSVEAKPAEARADRSRGCRLTLEGADFDVVLSALRAAAVKAGPEGTRAGELVALLADPGDLVAQVAELSRRLAALEHTYSLAKTAETS